MAYAEDVEEAARAALTGARTTRESCERLIHRASRVEPRPRTAIGRLNELRDIAWKLEELSDLLVNSFDSARFSNERAKQDGRRPNYTTDFHVDEVK